MKKIFITSIILTLLNSSDLISLALKPLGVFSEITYIFLSIILLGFVFKMYSFSLKGKELTFLLFLNAYLIIKFIQGVYYFEYNIIYSILVMYIWNYIFFVYCILIRFKPKDMYKLLYLILKNSILLYIALDFINLIVLGRHSLIVVIQNASIFWFLSFLVLFLLSDGKKEKIKLLTLFAILIPWVLLSYNLDPLANLQYKSIVILFITFFSYSFFHFFSFLLPSFRSSFSLKLLVPLVVFVFVMIGIVIVNYYEYIFELNNKIIISFEKRLLISLKMLSELSLNKMTILFGYGLGSSIKKFDFFYSNTHLIYPSHSGIMSLLYEHGALLLGMFYYLILSFFKKRIIYSNNFNQYQKKMSIYLIMLLFFIYFIMNIVYLYAIPIADYYHTSNIIILILMVIMMKNMFFTCKIK